MSKTEHYPSTGQLTSSTTNRVGAAEIYPAIQVLTVGAWAILPFAAVLVAPKDWMSAYFYTVLAGLAVLSFALYAVCFGLAEGLLVGLIFITNSAFADHAYLPKVSFLGGNFFFSDYYIILACCAICLLGVRRKASVLAGYRRHFIVLAVVVLISVMVSLSRGADVHYVLRELHPLVYYPLAMFLTVCALAKPGALARILVASTGIVVVSCAATLWQLLLISRFQFMTYASQVFGLAQGETLDAQSIRPPSQWLFLAFFMAAVATYPLWKKRRILMFGVVALDSICIFLGYSRSILFAIAGGLVCLSLIRKRGLLPFVWNMAKTIAVVAIILVVTRATVQELFPSYWEAFETRIIGSVEKDVIDPDKPWIFGSRLYEVSMAIDHIEEHPILGLGVGAAYREILPFEFGQTEVSDNPDDGRHFMHDTYLYVGMKYGLLGALAAGWIVAHFLSRTWVLARQTGAEALVPRGVLASFAGLAIANLVAPGFIASAAAPMLVGFMAGLIEASHSTRRMTETRTLRFEGGPIPLNGLTSFDGKSIV